MRRAGAALLAAFALMAAADPAAAHRLRVFATVEAGAVTGYAFFVGGGRPTGADVAFSDGEGRAIARTTTDAAGAFWYRPAVVSDIVITVDAGDGHVARTRLAAERFGDAGGATGAPANETAGTPPLTTEAAATDAFCTPDLAAVQSAVDQAVARQLRPLLEAAVEAESRIRFNDVTGGVGMIVGLAGTALWASARRRERRAAPADDRASA